MISAKDVTLRIEERTILDRVSIEVGRGESVGLVGPNGSGKTSLLRCLLGLVPFTGRASIDGHDVVREPVAARRRVAWLPQKPAFGDQTGYEALAFVASLRRIGRSRIAAALAEVGLEAHADEKARTYSGGMQQRLSLAAALLTGAPVLLLDEPTASLDRDGQEAFFAIASRLRDEGRTLLLASHRADEIRRLTDRVLELDGGRLVEVQSTPTAGIARVLPLSGVKGERR